MESTLGFVLAAVFAALFSVCIFVLPRLHEVLEQRRFRREIDAHDQLRQEPLRWSAEAVRRRAHGPAIGQRTSEVGGTRRWS
jgi:hypothetical protein